MDPETVETPVGIIDVARARTNARRVAEYTDRHRLGWRPHIKTHKSLEVARIQLDEGASGLTVATPREAEVMSTLTDDLLLAYPPVGSAKLRRVVAVAGRVDLKVALDAAEVLGPLAEAARAVDVTVGVLVEMDVGLGRVGVGSSDEVVALARLAHDTPGVTFRGLQFYPGHIRGAREEQGPALSRVADRLAEALAALHAEGLEPEVVSGGSTPTLWRSHELPGLTEIRSGSCIFYDREGLAVGVAGAEDLAYTVLTGSKALSKEERGADAGYGFVLEHPEVPVRSLSEEHGVLDLSGSSWVPAIGERVRIVPNHVCVSVNLQDRLLARDGEGHRWVELEARGRGPWNG